MTIEPVIAVVSYAPVYVSGVLLVSHAIYKYDLGPTDLQFIRLPKGAQLLHVETQHQGIKLWALVNLNESEEETRNILIKGTGHAIEEPIDLLKHISTFMTADKMFVFHAFEVVDDD